MLARATFFLKTSVLGGGGGSTADADTVPPSAHRHHDASAQQTTSGGPSSTQSMTSTDHDLGHASASFATPPSCQPTPTVASLGSARLSPAGALSPCECGLTPAPASPKHNTRWADTVTSRGAVFGVFADDGLLPTRCYLRLVLNFTVSVGPVDGLVIESKPTRREIVPLTPHLTGSQVIEYAAWRIVLLPGTDAVQELHTFTQTSGGDNAEHDDDDDHSTSEEPWWCIGFSTTALQLHDALAPPAASEATGGCCAADDDEATPSPLEEYSALRRQLAGLGHARLKVVVGLADNADAAVLQHPYMALSLAHRHLLPPHHRRTVNNTRLETQQQQQLLLPRDDGEGASRDSAPLARPTERPTTDGDVLEMTSGHPTPSTTPTPATADDNVEQTHEDDGESDEVASARLDDIDGIADPADEDAAHDGGTAPIDDDDDDDVGAPPAAMAMTSDDSATTDTTSSAGDTRAVVDVSLEPSPTLGACGQPSTTDDTSPAAKRCTTSSPSPTSSPAAPPHQSVVVIARVTAMSTSPRSDIEARPEMAAAAATSGSPLLEEEELGAAEERGPPRLDQQASPLAGHHHPRHPYDTTPSSRKGHLPIEKTSVAERREHDSTASLLDAAERAGQRAMSDEQQPVRAPSLPPAVVSAPHDRPTEATSSSPTRRSATAARLTSPLRSPIVPSRSLSMPIGTWPTTTATSRQATTTQKKTNSSTTVLGSSSRASRVWKEEKLPQPADELAQPCRPPPPQRPRPAVDPGTFGRRALYSVLPTSWESWPTTTKKRHRTETAAADAGWLALPAAAGNNVTPTPATAATAEPRVDIATAASRRRRDDRRQTVYSFAPPPLHDDGRLKYLNRHESSGAPCTSQQATVQPLPLPTGRERHSGLSSAAAAPVAQRHTGAGYALLNDRVDDDTSPLMFREMTTPSRLGLVRPRHAVRTT